MSVALQPKGCDFLRKRSPSRRKQGCPRICRTGRGTTPKTAIQRQSKKTWHVADGLACRRTPIYEYFRNSTLALLPIILITSFPPRTCPEVFPAEGKSVSAYSEVGR